MADQQAGWYPDPSGDASKLRYWDGTQWTNDFTDAANAVQPEAQPDDSAQPSQPVQPVEAVPPAQPVESAPQVYPAGVTESVETVQPVQPAGQPMPPAPPQMQGQPAPGQPQYPVQPSSFAPAPGAQPNQMQPPQYAPSPGAQPKKSRTGLIIGIVIAAVVIIALVIGAIVFVTSALKPSPTPPPVTSNGTTNNGSTGTDSGDDATEISGDVTGVVGEEYETKWFTFTVDSMETAQSYGDYTAPDGFVLLIAHITETNISGSEQPFGTFDWFVADGTASGIEYDPLDPFNNEMMPTEFMLDNDETASYDVVVEYPADLATPYLMYLEVDEYGTTYTTFKIPVK